MKTNLVFSLVASMVTSTHNRRTAAKEGGAMTRFFSAVLVAAIIGIFANGLVFAAEKTNEGAGLQLPSNEVATPASAPSAASAATTAPTVETPSPIPADSGKVEKLLGYRHARYAFGAYASAIFAGERVKKIERDIKPDKLVKKSDDLTLFISDFQTALGVYAELGADGAGVVGDLTNLGECTPKPGYKELYPAADCDDNLVAALRNAIAKHVTGTTDLDALEGKLVTWLASFDAVEVPDTAWKDDGSLDTAQVPVADSIRIAFYLSAFWRFAPAEVLAQYEKSGDLSEKEKTELQDNAYAQGVDWCKADPDCKGGVKVKSDGNYASPVTPFSHWGMSLGAGLTGSHDVGGPNSLTIHGGPTATLLAKASVYADYLWVRGGLRWGQLTPTYSGWNPSDPKVLNLWTGILGLQAEYVHPLSESFAVGPFGYLDLGVGIGDHGGTGIFTGGGVKIKVSQFVFEGGVGYERTSVKGIEIRTFSGTSSIDETSGTIAGHGAVGFEF